jgi:hypothetical protein
VLLVKVVVVLVVAVVCVGGGGCSCIVREMVGICLHGGSAV